ncbi:helix-hairpin-helix domain-containing protein [Evansella sp. AB-P1]|uniref:helix-hairpin-helix domain-containing protein n=1 Tax=Evansella sp. AB-P1 TaxID=3037653 RepID=UPI00241CC4C3|nr:helix-hairpin-helix domain-containing protein [Evansella sp. AB-P1]MDG5788408.1 helix-hairpin-helix domain-containing protein [Evansella sp. AB-P1]
MKTPSLPLTKTEKGLLRQAKVKLSDIHTLEIDTLTNILGISDNNAKMLRGLAVFQTIPSIGHKLAENLVYHLKICTLEDIKKEDGAALFDRLEETLGYWTDTCVEDQLRCVIHYANNPNSDKQWFHFTDERKKYRNTFGFPLSRPKKAWYD